jgi:hypothetical protein
MKSIKPPTDWLAKLNITVGPIRRRRYHAEAIEPAIVQHLVGVIRRAARSEKVAWREMQGVTWAQAKQVTVDMLREGGWGLASAISRAAPLMQRARITVQDELYQQKRGANP